MTERRASEDLLHRRRQAVPRGLSNTAPVFAARAEGSRVWDVDGREYLDFAGGIGVLNVGHNHPRVVAAIREQLDAFTHTCWHVAMYEPYVRVAERLNALAPVPEPAKTMLVNSGAEAVENAVKVARRATGRRAIVGFERGFHGRTWMALALTGKTRPYRLGLGPLAPEVYRLPYAPFYGRELAAAGDAEVTAACEAALRDLFAYHVAPDEVAAIVFEPVLGEGGFLPLRRPAMAVLARLAAEHGILLVADEIQSGCGRCGALFACQRYGAQPDLMVAGKSLAGGLPLAAVVGRAELMDAPGVGGLGTTYGGNPVACAAALAVLDVMAEADLPGRARAIGEQVMAAFTELQADHKAVGDARGLGAMCALEIVDPVSGDADKGRADRIVARAREAGLLVVTASGNVIRTLMPLTIGDDDLGRGLGILAEAVAAESG